VALPNELFETRHVRSSDGTRISYAVAGMPEGSPTLVIAGGWAPASTLWRQQLAYFADRMRVVTWDLRGLGASAGPHGRADGYGIYAQLADLNAVLDAEGVERFALLGWSVTASLALEAAGVHRDRVRALVLVSAAAFQPFGRGARLPADLGARAVALALLLWRHGARLYGTELSRSFARQLMRVALGPSAQPGTRGTLADALAASDPHALAATMSTLERHDARRHLNRLTLPSLVIAGSRDRLVPLALGQQLARDLPRSRMLVVAGGHHLPFLEFPDYVNLHLERFFDAAGLR
jgi:pimeloyl-ACP methyl ester carboxylesterase